MKKMFLSIDELTLILSVDRALLEGLADWQEKAQHMIAEFTKRANLESIFGTRNALEDKCPQGYSVGYQYGFHPFYFAVAYHPLHSRMGVIVKFSASGWSAYCKAGNMNVKKFLHAVKSDSYNIRLSRIDFAVDYQDWDISVDDIYQKLKNKRLEIRDSDGRKNRSLVTASEADGVAGTFYVGSRKTGTKLFLRVYDKKAEQLEKHGLRFEEALNTMSWVRFEAVFKSDYAHQLTKIIMETDDENLQDLIADKITEKYRFYDLEQEKYTDFSTALFEKSKRKFQHLHLESTRDNDLIASLLHLVNGSGLFSTLYKCDKIWGDKTSAVLLNHLHDIYTDEYVPNDDVLHWLKRHKDTLKKQTLEHDLEIVKSSRANT